MCSQVFYVIIEARVKQIIGQALDYVLDSAGQFNSVKSFTGSVCLTS